MGEFDAMQRALGRTYVPSLVLAAGEGASVTGMPLFEGRAAREGVADAYVCRQFACAMPVQTAEALVEQLGAR